MLPWLIFAIIILTLLILDLGVFNKKDHVMGFKESLCWSCFYVIIATIFGGYVYHIMGADHTKEYFTGYLLEKAMAMDNIFVISIIFKFFAIPAIYQHRVLFWGIFGVIILRAIMICLGAAVIENFAWVMYIFAAILILTGVKTWQMIDAPPMNIKEMWFYKWLSSHLNIYPQIRNNHFFVKEDNKLYVTPLFMALITIESMDLIFAIDSIPAIFAITTNTFIVYTSNIFAILGLRAMFFLLADLTTRFRYVKHALALILVLIGAKVFVLQFIYIPKVVPLILTIGLLVLGVVVSIIKQPPESRAR